MIDEPLKIINNKTSAEALSEIDSLVKKKERLEYVLVANLNHLAKIKRNSMLQRVYRDASMVLPDGKYVYWLSRLYGTPLKEYIRGLDFFYEICKLCVIKRYKCLMVGGKPGTVEKARGILETNYSGLDVKGAFFYPLGEVGGHIALDRQIIDALNKDDIDILFLGLGTPREQAWIENYKSHIKCVIIGVGSVYDFIAGEIVEAPRIFQHSGLEWFWRFFDEPKRLWKRYFIENTIFVIEALFDALRRRLLRILNIRVS